MRFVRYLYLALVSVLLVFIALANRDLVVLRLVPKELEHFSPIPVALPLPLFGVMLGGILIGLSLGIFREWVRERKIRATAARQARELRRLERELKQLKGAQHAGKNDVLALLDEVS